MKKGMMGFVTPYVWMFLSSYEKLRNIITNEASITSLIQLEYNAFAPACIPVSTFVLANHNLRNFKGSYIQLSEFKGAESQAPRTLEAITNPNCGWFYRASSEDFRKIPGNIIAYWISSEMLSAFTHGKAFSTVAEPQRGSLRLIMISFFDCGMKSL